MQEVYDFVEMCCLEQHIDDSHGLIHSKSTVQWAELIMASMDCSEEEQKFIRYGAALHDMCDSKYIDINKGQVKISEWLIAKGWSTELTAEFIHVIGTTSYSKLKQNKNKNNEIVYPEHGKWQRAYHIIRHADLLDAYRVESGMMYNQHIHPEMSELESWTVVKALFETRVFTYVSDGWIFYPAALALVPALEKTAREQLK